MIKKSASFICIFMVLLSNLLFGANDGVQKSTTPQNQQKGGIYTSWAYTNVVTVSNVNNPNTLTDYSVLLQINTAELISAGKMNSDGSDIRFTTNFYDELSYWIDPGIQNERGINNASTHIWIKVPLIPASGTTNIYMVYGNPGAAATSDISNTFIFGDDFDDNSLDYSKWEVLNDNQGQIFEQNGRLEHNSPKTSPQSNSSFYSMQSFTEPCVLEMQFKKGGYVYRTIGLKDQPNTDNNVAYCQWQDWGAFSGGITVNGTTFGVSFRDDYWSRNYNPEYYIKIIRHPDEKFSIYEDVPSFEPGGPQSFFGQPAATMPLNTPLRVFAWEGVWVSSPSLLDRYEDNIRVRKYSEPEPTAHIDKSLVAFYPFNGNSNDESGNGNNPTYVNVSPTNDRFNSDNNAILLNGSDNYIETPHSASLDFSGEISVCAWINPSRVDISQQAISSKGGGWNRTGWLLTLNNDKIRWHLGNGSSEGMFDTQKSIKPNEWTYIVATWKDGIMNVYINGIKDINSVNWAGGLYSNTYNHFIGKTNFVDFYYSGAIDDVKVYSAALSEQEILNQYTEGGYSQISDIDGNVYRTVKIGNQEWMAENLKTTKYNNGDDIDNVVDNGTWTGLSTGAYCWYNNDIANKTTYGALYNWYAVNDSRNICPTGWHVPSDSEWFTLENFVDPSINDASAIDWRGTDGGTKLKANSLWFNEGNGTDSYGFSALPSGYRYWDVGTFINMNTNGTWWSSSQKDGTNSWYRGMTYDMDKIHRYFNPNQFGFSVRCIKDSPTESTITFKVDMTDALADGRLFFDPAQHDVYISGSLNQSWPEPGSASEYKLADIGGNKYSITLTLSPGEIQYKYFIVPHGSGSTWSFGEWPGEPNRTIQYDGNALVINDKWGVLEGYEFVRDYDNNIYHARTIGEQKWTNVNLFTTHYSNGDPIEHLADNSAWSNTNSGAYSWYNNDHATYANNYGALYNWFATIDPRNICPVGWHVPTDNDWKKLEMFLGMTQVDADNVGWRGTDQATQLKRPWGWYDNGNGTDNYWFEAKPGGRRLHSDGSFDLEGQNGYWWTSTATSAIEAYYRNMNYYTSQINREPINIRDGYSVRCVKDKEPLPNYTLNLYINDQNWNALDSVKVIFRNTSYDSKVVASNSIERKSKIVRSNPIPIDDNGKGLSNVNIRIKSKTEKLNSCPFDYAKFNSVFREYLNNLSYVDIKVEFLPGSPADYGFEMPAGVSSENLLGITIDDIWFDGSKVKVWINTNDLSLYIPNQNIFPDYDPTYGPIWIYDAHSGYINPCLMTINFRATPRLPESGYWWGGEYPFEYLHSSTQIVKTDINGFVSMQTEGGDYSYKATKSGFYTEESTLSLNGDSDYYITLFSGFDAGDGSEANPFQISNATQLNFVREFIGPEYSDKYFVLTSDIELGVSPWNQGEGWEPIGDLNNRFLGIINGNGYVIRNLTINRPQQDFVGLFGYASTALFSNIYLENIAINGKARVAGLVGRMNSSTIENCRSNGTVYAFENWAGGLVGISYNSCNIVGSYSNANVTAQGFSVGGLSGTIEVNSKVENCYATGNSTANSDVGGLVGWCGNSTIINSYSIGGITGSTNYGGLVGGVDGTNSIINSYWNIETSYVSSSNGGDGRTTVQMKTPFDQNTYVSWDFEGVWFDDVESNLNNGYPYIRYFVSDFPIVETDSNVSDITETGANVYAYISSEGASFVYERGFVWSTTPNPNLSNNYDGWSNNGNGAGSFNHAIVGLPPNTKIYFRAFAKNGAGTSYGLQRSFKTGSTGTFTVYYNNPEKWGQVNIWIWGGDGSFTFSWPGDAMSPPEAGSIWYSYQIPSSYTHLLFNNNGLGLQTIDLTRSTSGWFDGTQWYDTEPFNSEGSLTDIDGNKYRTVTIGNQTWMAQNLKTTKYKNGSSIQSPGAQYWYNNNNQNKYIYGALYNWYAVTNPAGLCPDGWRVPSLDDWNVLLSFVGSNANQLKTAGNNQSGTGIWASPSNASNDYGFSVVPSGYFNTSVYTDIFNSAQFWSTSEDQGLGKHVHISFDSDYASTSSYSKEGGFGVRCLLSGPAVIPTVTTYAIGSITQSTATGGGNVTSDGGATITARGVVWSTSQNPTTSSYVGITNNGTGTGAFTSNLTGLTANTRYYVRAYATNSAGTAYGNQVEFTTSIISVPTLTTKNVQLLSVSSASSGGVISSNGGANITSRGVVWSTSQNPTISSYIGRTTDGSGDGEFNSSLTGLEFNTRYYVRAYATNSQGTGYGNQVEFTTALAVGFNVVDHTGTPIGGAAITVGVETKYTDGSGNAIFYRGSGTFGYTVSASGYISTTGTFTVGSSDINVNIRLLADSPATPSIKGETSVCLGSEVVYGISGAGSGTWYVANGTISASSASSVTVQWNIATTTGYVRYRIVDQWGYIETYQLGIEINTAQVVQPQDKPVIHAKGSIPILICTTPDLTYQWKKNGESLQGQTGQYYVARNQTGEFHVQVKLSNNCPSTSNGYGVNSKSAGDLTLSVYPNPTRGEFTLQMDGDPTGEGVITISNTLGKTVVRENLRKSEPVAGKDLDLDLPPGVYIVSVRMDDGTIATTKLTIF